MKRLLPVKIGFFVLTVVLSLIIVTTVVAASKSYNGVTTVSYNNSISDSGGFGWNGGYYDSTSPSRSMDQFGYNYWQTYISCNFNINYDSVISYSNTYQNNVSSISNGMACLKRACPAGQTMRGHDYVQHYWQDSPYSVDGGTLSTYMT